MAMATRFVFGFPRTIYQLKERSAGFLDPWSSLKPSFLRRKIAPEILGVFLFRKNKLDFEPFFRVKDNFVDPAQLDERWALVFPKRSYLPFSYPHFQLWLLTRRYVPSPQFINLTQMRILVQVMRLLFLLYNQYREEKKKEGKIVFGYNSTPFSFIKDKEGRYWAGGQSVRVFHLHSLLVPPPRRLRVKEEDLFLVYPTDFSRGLLTLFFSHKEFQNQIGMERKRIKIGERGVEIDSFGTNLTSLFSLWRKIKKIDRIFYQLQLVLITAFYQDGEKFVEKLRRIEGLKDIAQGEKLLPELILVGRERPLKEIRERVVAELKKMCSSFGICFPEEKIVRLTEHLVINSQGDLASMVEGKEVVLRPGMGYALLFEETERGRLRIKINPLDVLGPKGMIESSGYWFERKIIKNSYPLWAGEILVKLIKKIKNE